MDYQHLKEQHVKEAMVSLKAWQENVKVAIKRCAVEGAKKMSKKSTNRAPTRKIVTHKQTVKESRPTTSKKKGVSANFLQMSINNQEECSFSDL